MPRQTATVTTKQEVTIAPQVARHLLTELDGYAAISKEMKALDESKRNHSDRVLHLSEKVDGDKFELEGYKVAVVRGARDRRLDKDQLIKHLVRDGKYTLKGAQKLLNDCTTDKEKKMHVRITVPGDADIE